MVQLDLAAAGAGDGSKIISASGGPKPQEPVKQEKHGQNDNKTSSETTLAIPTSKSAPVRTDPSPYQFPAPMAVTSWAAGRLDIVGLGVDKAVYHKAFDTSLGSQWIPSAMNWDSLVAGFVAVPVAASWGPNRLDVFNIGPDFQCYIKSWDGSAWSDWTGLGRDFGFNGRLAVTSWGPGRLDVFGIQPFAVDGNNNQMYHKAFDTANGSQWQPSLTGWDALGGNTIFGDNSSPTVVSWGPNRLDIFALGIDRQIYHKGWDGTQWVPSPTDWESLGGTFSDTPIVTSWGPNRIDLFGLGTDRQPYIKSFDGNAWSPDWSPLGGTFNSNITAVSWGPGRIDLFGLGTDDQMYHKAFDTSLGSVWLPSLTDWEALGGTFTSGAAVASWGPGRLDVFGIGTDSQMYIKSWDGSAWSPSGVDWTPLGGNFKYLIEAHH
jgi:hypothetical protein